MPIMLSREQRMPIMLSSYATCPMQHSSQVTIFAQIATSSPFTSPLFSLLKIHIFLQTHNQVSPSVFPFEKSQHLAWWFDEYTFGPCVLVFMISKLGNMFSRHYSVSHSGGDIGEGKVMRGIREDRGDWKEMGEIEVFKRIEEKEIFLFREVGHIVR